MSTAESVTHQSGVCPSVCPAAAATHGYCVDAASVRFGPWVRGRIHLSNRKLSNSHVLSVDSGKRKSLIIIIIIIINGFVYRRKVVTSETLIKDNNPPTWASEWVFFSCVYRLAQDVLQGWRTAVVVVRVDGNANYVAVSSIADYVYSLAKLRPRIWPKISASVHRHRASAFCVGDAERRRRRKWYFHSAEAFSVQFQSSSQLTFSVSV